MIQCKDCRFECPDGTRCAFDRPKKFGEAAVLVDGHYEISRMCNLFRPKSFYPKDDSKAMNVAEAQIKTTYFIYINLDVTTQQTLDCLAEQTKEFSKYIHMVQVVTAKATFEEIQFITHTWPEKFGCKVVCTRLSTDKPILAGIIKRSPAFYYVLFDHTCSLNPWLLENLDDNRNKALIQTTYVEPSETGPAVIQSTAFWLTDGDITNRINQLKELEKVDEEAPAP